MAGKNAKKRAKAAKVVGRSLEMSKTMWQMLANASLMADVHGAAAPLAAKCRLLAARAEYYLGEPENKNGLVRGELTSEEWAAFQELVAEFADASPPLRAFAQAMGEVGADRPMIVREVDNPKNQGEQAQQDAEAVHDPDALEYLVTMLDRMVSVSERTAPPTEQVVKDAMASIRSACKKLEALRESIVKSGGRGTVSLLLSTLEARSVCDLLWEFKATVHEDLELPPERTGEKEKVDRFLGCAVRFFARMADDHDVTGEAE